MKIIGPKLRQSIDHNQSTCLDCSLTPPAPEPKEPRVTPWKTPKLSRRALAAAAAAGALDFYDYRLDPARAVPGLLSRFSGPQRNIGT